MWNYGIVYIKNDKEYIIAEIYESKTGLSFCRATVGETKLDELHELLLELVVKILYKNYYIWNGEVLKHASKQN